MKRWCRWDVQYEMFRKSGYIPRFYSRGRCSKRPLEAWWLPWISSVIPCTSVISESLSPQHGASSGWWWNGLQIWRVTTNILNEQSWTVHKGWSSSFGGWNRRWKLFAVKTYDVTKHFTSLVPLVRYGVHTRIILEWIFKKWVGSIDWIDLAQDRDRWPALMNAVMNFQVA